MKKRPPTLAAAAITYQERVVIPHCASCTRPCCKLDELVLEMEWSQARALYKIGGTRHAFDQAVHEGTGPEDIRESFGRYYAHGKPCPAYDLETRRCAVYATPAKPAGCSEFPVYKDGNVVTADLRCEAVHADELHRHLEQETGRPVQRAVDAQFSFFVTYEPVKNR